MTRQQTFAFKFEETKFVTFIFALLFCANNLNAFWLKQTESAVRGVRHLHECIYIFHEFTHLWSASGESRWTFDERTTVFVSISHLAKPSHSCAWSVDYLLLGYSVVYHKFYKTNLISGGHYEFVINSVAALCARGPEHRSNSNLKNNGKSVREWRSSLAFVLNTFSIYLFIFKLILMLGMNIKCRHWHFFTSNKPINGLPDVKK